jgi:hypothetical protein
VSFELVACFLFEVNALIFESNSLKNKKIIVDMVI